MAMSFSEQHAMSLLQPYLAQGERVLYRARGVEKPWYSKLFARLGSLFWRNYFVAATDQRILFVQHAGMLGGFAAKKVDSLSWHEVDRAALGWGIFNKDLTVQSQAKAFKKSVTLGRFWMKDNFTHAESMVQVWTASRGALPGGANPRLPQAAY